MRKCILSLMIILGLLLLAGCGSCPLNGPCGSAPSARQATPASHPYRIHVVKRGDTLWRLAKRYNISLQDLMAVNHIQDPSHISVGSRLIIPSRHYVHPNRVPSFSASQTAETRREGFIWPVRGKIITFFGKTKSKISKGIVIQAPRGADIRAAQSGKVIFSGNYGPFGHTVILQHPDSFSTVYSHNQKNFVKVGQWVKQGQVIATVGMTGHVTHPCLEFEIRKKSKAVDPLIYLRTP